MKKLNKFKNIFLQIYKKYKLKLFIIIYLRVLIPISTNTKTA
jgi:hypothetical protein